MIGLAIWGACFLAGLVYLLVSLRTFREHTLTAHEANDGTEHTRTVNASPHCTGEAS